MTNGSTGDRNLGGNGGTSTQKRATARATAWSMRVAGIWCLWGVPKPESENKSFWNICKITNDSNGCSNLGSNGDTSTQLCATARATAWGMRAAGIWNLLGFPKSEPENESFGYICKTKTGDNACRNLGGSRDASTQLCATARATA